MSSVDHVKFYYKYDMERPTIFQNGRYLIYFNQTKGNLITGDKQQAGTMRKFNTKYIEKVISKMGNYSQFQDLIQTAFQRC